MRTDSGLNKARPVALAASIETDKEHYRRLLLLTCSKQNGATGTTKLMVILALNTSCTKSGFYCADLLFALSRH